MAVNPDTGISAIDEAIAQCLRYGTINCIHAEQGSGENELCYALLTSHLLRSAHSTATVIDVGSSFDVRKMHQNLHFRLQGHEGTHDTAVQVLGRLNISQVFDVEGLADAIAEVRQSLEPSIELPSTEKALMNPIKSTIDDSEDEDDLLDDPAPAHLAPDQISTASNHAAAGFLVLSNFHQIMAPSIKSNHVQGQSLLVSFMRSLQHLSKAHHLCTVIFSGVTAYPKAREDTPSAFASCNWRPVLGKAFPHLLDSEMLLYRASSLRTENQKGNEENSVSIIEILQNSDGRGLGRWAPFIIGAEGRLMEFT